MTRSIVRSFVLAVATTLVAAAGFSQAQAVQVHPGDQSRWSLDFRTCLEQRSATPIEVHMAGDWTSTITAVRTGQYDARLQLSELHFSGDAAKSASAAALAGLEARLSRPFWATYRDDGEVVAVHFFRDMAPSDRNLLQMIATESSLSGPVRCAIPGRRRSGTAPANTQPSI